MAPQPSVNRSMPDCSIIPVLGYTDVVAAIGYLTKTFGFTERWRTGNHRAQLSFGNGAIAITDATSPIPQHLMVRVANVIAHHDHALEQGASILQPLTDFPYGERQYTVQDMGGHIWMFTQSIADVAPEDWGGVTAR